MSRTVRIIVRNPSRKINHLGRIIWDRKIITGFTRSISSMHKTKKMIDRGKRSQTLSEVKPVKNISKNLQSFLEINSVQKEVLPSHKLQDHAYECYNPFGLKEDNLSQRNCQNQLGHPGLSHTEQECQESLTEGKIHNQQNSNKGLKCL